jgi:hypothetical protein
MADEAQVAMLKRSVEEWNDWRRRSDFSPDLSVADFSGMDLSGADLARTALRKSNLKATNLSHARLDDADLSLAEMAGANLSGAALRGTEFYRANLSLANLNNARMTTVVGGDMGLHGRHIGRTAFHRTNLRGTDFTNSVLSGVLFVAVDLSQTQGLSSCVHNGPSTLDHRTLQLSKGLPLQFLRGCGLPEALIDYIPALMSEPLQFYSVFVSFSTADQSFAERLHADLQNRGVRCWFAPHDIAAGKKLHEQIDEAIRVYDRLLVILSEASMASEWVKTEIANARQKELRQQRQVLFPISLVPFARVREWRAFDADTGKDSAREIREYFIPDFSNWKDHDSYKAAFDKLLKGLKAEEQPPTQASD